MAKSEAVVRLAGLTGMQGMLLGLGLVATEAAGRAARDGGYRPTADEWRAVSASIRDAVVAMAALIEDWAAVTDEQLEAAARDLGAAVLVAILGPPPMVN